MKLFSDIDLLNFGQLKNAILHTMPDIDTFNTSNMSDGALVYLSNTGKIIYNYDGQNKTIATLDDIKNAEGNKTFISVEDPSSTIVIEDGDFWYNTSDNSFKIRNNNAWASIQNNTVATTIVIWQPDTPYENNTVVNHNHNIYQNLTGGDVNTSTFSTDDWTLLTGSTGVRKTIPKTLLSGNTINDITRSLNVYTITHNLNNQQIRCDFLKENQPIFVKYEIIDNNNVNIIFKKSLQERDFDVDIIITLL